MNATSQHDRITPSDAPKMSIDLRVQGQDDLDTSTCACWKAKPLGILDN